MLHSDPEMLHSKRIFLTLLLAVMSVPALKLFAGALSAPAISIQPVRPGEIHAGEILTVRGRSLDSSHVVEIYLNNGQADFPVDILDQASSTIRMRVPANTPAGHMRFAIRPTAHNQVLDQPVFLKVLPALGAHLI